MDRVSRLALNQTTDERGPCAFRPNTDARYSLGLGSARVLSAQLDVYGGHGSVKSRGSAWRLSWSARQLDLAARYHYNISNSRILAISKPFLPLVLPFEVSMVPNRQRKIGLGVYFDK